jgi:hypothetical protein
VSNLLEHVLVIDEGRILMDQDAEQLRGSAALVTGRRADVDTFVSGRKVLHREIMHGLTSVTVADRSPQAFPFALGYSVTRRDFYLGTSLLFVLISAFNAAAFTILTQIEQVTDGWGLNTHLFNSLWFGLDAWYVDLLSFFVLQMLVFFVGASVATIYMRWRMRGILVSGICMAVAVVGAAALTTYTNSWPAVGAWFGAQGVAGIFLWLLVPTALAALGGFLILGRATPKG